MTATATEQPVLDRLGVLAAGGEHGVVWTAGQRGEQSVQRADRLRTVRPAGGKETMRAALALKDGETRYNVRSTADFLKRFGGGKEDVTKMSSSEKASYKKAQEVLHKDAKIALFLELRMLSATEQTALLKDKDICSAIGERSGTAFTALRDTVLDSIARDSSFIAMFPEISAHVPPLTDPQRRDFIEKTLMPAEDGRLASRLGTRMQEAYKSALELTPIATDEKRIEMEQQKQVEEERLEQKSKSLKALLDGQGIVNPVTIAAYTQVEINTLIKGSLTAETAADTIAESALGKGHTILVDLKQLVLELPKQRIDLVAQLVAKGATNPPTTAWLTDPRNASLQEVIDYKRTVSEMGRLNTAYPAVNPDLTLFKTRILPLYRNSAFSTLTMEAKQAELKAADLDLQIKVLPKTTEDMRKSQVIRIVEEEDLCGLMDGILGQSIADVLEERYDVMQERNGRLSTEDQKKAEQDIQKLVLELKKKMNSNWIGFDATTHKKTVNKDQIKKDVTHLGFTYDKDMALKQLIARDLFHGKQRTMPGGGAYTISLTHFDKLNVIDGTDETGAQLLTAEDLTQLNKVFELTGQEYRDKLFADLLAARTIGDRSWNFGFGMEAVSGKLGFKRGEWQQMLKLYEPEITKGLEENTEAAAAMRSLEAQGVKIDHNMKWLWYVLAVLLGVGGGALGGAAGLPAINALKGAGAAFIGHGTSRIAGEVAGAALTGVAAKKTMDAFSEN
ncbi:hypothetical protein A2334_00795 [Candidatus Roizmanbacteria bacterium RIFOXYB2_FULL_38_10]|uniref:Uncharacterized protein n=1 Tax=Candidatus Roizmanbacteria bacterium RIFOXYD1_FULL_38_12 TaxID=1802093 RepID=A0A1F7L1E8_9BACT|nr:MAG: hypothetical protein A3K47_04090 [Candidatus Roizmanbacteria bacterium RIFOXYA2_FULL_38_14]OGK63938.1 MAG: hypothetical protein A3K27_04090 [Candidatus Roizmanbacteria bacterium RIFOXYA1_FULL_37_12]OGK65784.1 MAG: hypothetical protein A3K38_04090 [Candidatus Roizmanbacteria bacterium RIFOXYB1_FULL_40_23]OGK68892.1 MAG: hypothetical protein A2334_00795 [Candidatus Roizmanbacteria bacterium RIFOXYB2_FULL_38_10]OGK70189.1 MAG: hypothetical protein A3K21_04095 [Candidatus Roizmanbacteria ba